jgi:hypothetical protein
MTPDESADLWRQWQHMIASAEPDPLAVARMASTFERYFDSVKTEAVRAARATGHSWEDVARAVGTTRQSAWQRYRWEQDVRAGKSVDFWTRKSFR